MVLSKCLICTYSIDPSSRRYGGACCNACAAFFYRSVQMEKEYSCNTGTYDCLKEPSLNGKGCQKCRFAKCFEIGMSTPSTFAKKLMMEEKKELDERTLFAQIADSFLTFALKFPAIFESYIKEENQQFLKISLEPFKTDENGNLCLSLKPVNTYLISTEPMHPFVYLLKKHSFAQDEFPTFSHFCLCQFEFNNLNETKRMEMKKLQKSCLERVCSRVGNKDRLPYLQQLSVHFLNIFYGLNYM